jgi:hypothetical protein
MKNLLKLKISVILIGSIVLSSCGPNPEKIFKGEVIIVNKPSTDKLIGEKLEFDGVYTGQLIVRDSLIFFISSLYGAYNCATFNVNTGKHVGNFFNTGQGPREFISFSFMYFESGYDAWINDSRKGCYVLINMKSGEEKKRINISGLRRGAGTDLQEVILNDSLFILSEFEIITLPGNKYIITPIKYRKINYLSREDVVEYDLFDLELYQKLWAGDDGGFHLSGSNSIKPDKSKIVNAMNFVYQINILDLKTGKVQGYRIAGTHGFRFVRSPLVFDPLKNVYANTYIRSITSDNIFIYVLLHNSTQSESVVFHVFDWNGNFVRILETDQKGMNFGFGFDDVRRKIYIKDDVENVWVYDVEYLYH